MVGQNVNRDIRSSAAAFGLSVAPVKHQMGRKSTAVLVVNLVIKKSVVADIID